MQIALQDYRRWGNLKVVEFMQNSYKVSIEDIMSAVSKFNSKYYDIDCVTYSFPDNWVKIKDDVSYKYDGLEMLMYSIEPFIDTGSVDAVCKRKFRNTWTKIWSNFTKDVNLSETEMVLLSDFGIRLAYALSKDKNLHKNKDIAILLYFYNSILKWSYFTFNEIAFSRNNVTYEEVLDYLIVKPTSYFVDEFVFNVQ